MHHDHHIIIKINMSYSSQKWKYLIIIPNANLHSVAKKEIAMQIKISHGQK